MKLCRLVMWFVLFGCLASSADDESRFRPNPWQLSAKLGANVSAPSSMAASDKRFPFSTGLGVDYFVTRVMGGFITTEIISRGFSQAGSSSTTTFLDLGTGFSVRIGSHWFTETSMSLFRFAVFYSQPFSDYSGGLAPPFGVGSRGYFGLSFAQDILFPVSENWKIGFCVGGKVGLSDAVAASSVKFYEANLSFVAALR